MFAFKFLCFCLILSLSLCQKPPILPYPKSISFGNDTISVDLCNLNYIFTDASSKASPMPAEFTKIIAFFFQKTFPEFLCSPRPLLGDPKNPITLHLRISDPKMAYPGQKTNETYELQIEEVNNWYLTAENYFGFLRAFETLLQLLSPSGSLFQVSNFPISISDSPSFPYRGIMIDTSRHFLKPSTLKRILDGMLYNKLNVLHWHIVDEESFPMALLSFPEISKYGAYSQNEAYSVSDIKELVEYARERGVRLIPEVDSPGHTRSWGYSENFSNITVKCGPFEGQLDPTVNLTYEVVRGILEDTLSYFPDEFVHLGGDEVNSDCWLSKPWIKDFMDQKGLKTAIELQDYYKQQQKKMLPSSRKAVYWVFNENFTFLADEVIQFWGGTNMYAAIQNLPNPVILSPSNVLYLDVGVGNTYGDKSWGGYSTWKDIYNFDPYPKEIRKERILGAEVCLWSEINNDATTDIRLWGRSSAFAERMWNAEIKDTEAEIVRRLFHVERMMMKRGIGVSPVSSEYCSRRVGDCF